MFDFQVVLNPSMYNDTTLLEKYAGHWVYKDGSHGMVFTIIPEDKKWILMDKSGVTYQLQYQNETFYCPDKGWYFIYDTKTKKMQAL